MSKALEQSADSHIRKKDDFLFALTIDRFKKDGKTFFTTNKIGFKADISDKVKLGRLPQGTDFYLSHTAQEGKAVKIMTSGGKPGILLSHAEMYEEIKSPLEKTVSFIVVSLFVIAALSIVLTILAETGWLIVIGILLIPLFYLIYLVVGLPLYLILYELGKRF